jgi:hypothetical protein
MNYETADADIQRRPFVFIPLFRSVFAPSELRSDAVALPARRGSTLR